MADPRGTPARRPASGKNPATGPVRSARPLPDRNRPGRLPISLAAASWAASSTKKGKTVHNKRIDGPFRRFKWLVMLVTLAILLRHPVDPLGPRALRAGIRRY